MTENQTEGPRLEREVILPHLRVNIRTDWVIHLWYRNKSREGTFMKPKLISKLNF